MVTKRKQHSSKNPAKQGRGATAPQPNKIGASTPYDFRGKNLTPYGGLLPVATLLEKLGFQELLEETLSVKRITRVMSLYQFVLALVLGLYVGFARLNQLRFIARDPILTGILKVTRLPPQSTLWRFLASLHLNVARQILSMQRQLRERAWAAANVRLTTVTLDTDTTVHTLYGQQMGGRKSYNPKNKGKRSYQPILTFLAETREYLMGGVAQRRPAHGQTDRGAPGERFPGFAGRREEDFLAGRFRLLLLGSGGSLPTSALSVRHRSAQDQATGRAVAASGMEALAPQ